MRPRLTFGLFCLACVAALAAVGWGVARSDPGEICWQVSRPEMVDLPPAPTVECGGHTEDVEAWSASWDGPEGAFTACGPAPTDLYVRSELPVFSAGPGDILTLDYFVPPDRLRVYFTYDVPEEEWGKTLYDGRPGEAGLSLALPDNCGGVYELSAQWDLGDLGKGGNACAFLVCDPERGNEILLREPPYLTVEWEGMEQTLWRGGYTWQWKHGENNMQEGVSSDSPQPLDVLDGLPQLRARPGDRLTLGCSVRPDELEVWAYPLSEEDGGGADGPLPLTEETVLVLPENGTNTVYEVRGTWSGLTNCGGTAGYAFYVPD